jgi:hypothetical protein
MTSLSQKAPTIQDSNTQVLVESHSSFPPLKKEMSFDSVLQNQKTTATRLESNFPNTKPLIVPAEPQKEVANAAVLGVAAAIAGLVALGYLATVPAQDREDLQNLGIHIVSTTVGGIQEQWKALNKFVDDLKDPQRREALIRAARKYVNNVVPLRKNPVPVVPTEDRRGGVSCETHANIIGLPDNKIRGWPR